MRILSLGRLKHKTKINNSIVIHFSTTLLPICINPKNAKINNFEVHPSRLSDYQINKNKILLLIINLIQVGGRQSG